MRPGPVLLRPTLALVVAVATIGASCGSAPDSDGTGTAGQAVAAAGSATPVEQEGAASASVVLPGAFPAQVPVPEGVEVREAVEHTGTSSTMFEVTAWSEVDPLEVAVPYQELLQGLGYEVTSRVEAPDSLFFVMEDGDWLVSAGFFRDPVTGAGTSVGVTVVPSG